MKKSALLLSLTAAATLLLAACNDTSSETIATSKVGDVTKEELYNEMKASVGEQALQVLMIEKVLEDKYDVSDKEIQAEFDKQKEQMGENFEATLESQGQTTESFKKYIRLNLLQEKALLDGVEVTNEEIQAQYDRLKTELHARHILVADEATALEVKEKLEAGGDFSALAKEYSTEPAAQESGGDLGWFGASQMVAEFTDAAYSLEVNKISDPVQTEYGFHIIQVMETREVEMKESFEDKKAELKKELQTKKADRAALLEKVSKMMKDADIEIQDKDLKKALDQFLKSDEK